MPYKRDNVWKAFHSALHGCFTAIKNISMSTVHHANCTKKLRPKQKQSPPYIQDAPSEYLDGSIMKYIEERNVFICEDFRFHSTKLHWWKPEPRHLVQKPQTQKHQPSRTPSRTNILTQDGRCCWNILFPKLGKGKAPVTAAGCAGKLNPWEAPAPFPAPDTAAGVGPGFTAGGNPENSMAPTDPGGYECPGFCPTFCPAFWPAVGNTGTYAGCDGAAAAGCPGPAAGAVVPTPAAAAGTGPAPGSMPVCCAVSYAFRNVPS